MTRNQMDPPLKCTFGKVYNALKQQSGETITGLKTTGQSIVFNAKADKARDGRIFINLPHNYRIKIVDRFALTIYPYSLDRPKRLLPGAVAWPFSYTNACLVAMDDWHCSSISLLVATPRAMLWYSHDSTCRVGAATKR
jgi:hypothetical protein